MIRIFAFLPSTRFLAGHIVMVEEPEAILVGPARARGEADNSGAQAHDNPQEDPTRAYGDHPAGVYRVGGVTVLTPPNETYGSVFIRLVPQDGEALEAAHAGRTGIGIHGGRLHADGRLRETFGCLRVDDPTAQALAAVIERELAASREVFYICYVGPALE